MAKAGKTRKAVAKRFKVTGTGKLKFRSPGKRHLATGKSRKRKRQLGSGKTLTPADHARMMRCLSL